MTALMYFAKLMDDHGGFVDAPVRQQATISFNAKDGKAYAWLRPSLPKLLDRRIEWE